MWVFVVFIYVVAPMLALILSGLARSRVATWLLRMAAVISLALFALSMLATLDCIQSEFTFTSCNHLPDAFGDLMGMVQILYVIGYFTAGPAVILVSAIFEWWARRRPTSD